MGGRSAGGNGGSDGPTFPKLAAPIQASIVSGSPWVTRGSRARVRDAIGGSFFGAPLLRSSSAFRVGCNFARATIRGDEAMDDENARAARARKGSPFLSTKQVSFYLHSAFASCRACAPMARVRHFVATAVMSGIISTSSTPGRGARAGGDHRRELDYGGSRS